MSSKLESDVCCHLQVAPSDESYGGNHRPESNGILMPGLRRDSLHVTCGLTACTPGPAPGPMLGNEYGKTLPLVWLSAAVRVWCVSSKRLSAPCLSARSAARSTEFPAVIGRTCHSAIFMRMWHIVTSAPVARPQCRGSSHHQSCCLHPDQQDH